MGECARDHRVVVGVGSREPGEDRTVVWGPSVRRWATAAAACSGEAVTMTCLPGHPVQEDWQNGPSTVV
ncbi:hypothetical protein NS330_16670 [Curtobacterium citreum]|nr:hypothetical protein NS330_16670 [Curtobacterium citreum]